MQFEVRLHIGRQLFRQRTKGLFESGERLHDAIQVARREIEAVGLRNTYPVLHDIYDIESSGLERAVHSAPARTTMAAMKLHNRMATEWRKMEYSRSSFACM